MIEWCFQLLSRLAHTHAPVCTASFQSSVPPAFVHSLQKPRLQFQQSSASPSEQTLKRNRATKRCPHNARCGTRNASKIGTNSKRPSWKTAGRLQRFKHSLLVHSCFVKSHLCNDILKCTETVKCTAVKPFALLSFIQTISLHRCYHLCDSVTLHVTNSLLHVSLHFKAESTATRQCKRPFCHTFREAPTQTSVHCVCLLCTSSYRFPAELQPAPFELVSLHLPSKILHALPFCATVIEKRP